MNLYLGFMRFNIALNICALSSSSACTRECHSSPLTQSCCCKWTHGTDQTLRSWSCNENVDLQGATGAFESRSTL
ncbi:hypothetical protein CCR75_009329 [Bremia lactucae]|uniref:Uncharacterized protein n=1 Tax=Bremia lactucae TaxID=4779 RepID=A0A976IGB6_BRELC|nr:hypothetical protein CCR75_009329 [Bremia lactucae]